MNRKTIAILGVLAAVAFAAWLSLVDYAYYTYVTVDQKNIDLASPKDYRVEWAFGQLTLLMTLPLKMPVEVKSATLQVFDVSYYTAFTFPPKEPFKLTGAPAGCTAAYVPPQQPDTATLLSLYSIPADQRTIPPDLRQTVAKLSNVITVSCP